MPSVLSRQLETNNEKHRLYETKPFQQARERTFLQWQLDSYPCRMKMKEAGWFIVRNDNDELVTICLYCKKAYKGWNSYHDPYKVHQFFSPECVFVSFVHTISTPSSPIIKSIPRREQVQPSSHQMAMLPERKRSFEQWPLHSFQPSFDVFADAGLFYNGQNRTIECFSCHGQISIVLVNDNPMSAHTNRCHYARHLRVHSQRHPLNIRPSTKTYEFETTNMNNMTFYFLRCISASTPDILLATSIILSDGKELEKIIENVKRLRVTDNNQREINRMTSSDGALVDILKNLAKNPIDLATAANNLECSTEISLPLLTQNTLADSVFQCRVCLTNEASPHIVPIGCCHLGLCLKECFSKWMTCVICGYTIGKSIRIYGV